MTLADVNDAYRIWYRWFRNSTDTGTLPLPVPYSFTRELREVWDQAMENLDDIGDFIDDAANRAGSMGILGIFLLLGALILAALAAAAALIDDGFGALTTIGSATIRYAACLIYEQIYAAYENFRLAVAMNGLAFPLLEHLSEPRIVHWGNPSLPDSSDGTTGGLAPMLPNNRCSRRDVLHDGLTSTIRCEPEPPFPPARCRTAISTRPRCGTRGATSRRTSASSAISRISHAAATSDPTRTGSRASTTTAASSATRSTFPAPYTNASPVANGCPTSTSTATEDTATCAGASRAILRRTSRTHSGGPSTKRSSADRRDSAMPENSFDDIHAYIAELRDRARKSQAESHQALDPLYREQDRKPPGDFVESSFLYMRSCDVDNGSRPFPCPVFWLSPDLRVAPLSNLGAPTRELIAGGSYRFTAVVRNRGDLIVPSAKVEFWLVTPTLGFDTRFAVKIGVAADRVMAFSATEVSVDYTVPPTVSGHRCLFARVFSFAPLDIPVDDFALNPVIDRHVAQQNLDVVASGESFVLDWVHHRNAAERLELVPMTAPVQRALRLETVTALTVVGARHWKEASEGLTFETAPGEGAAISIEQKGAGLELQSSDPEAVSIERQADLTKQVLAGVEPSSVVAATNSVTAASGPVLRRLTA